MVAGEMSDQQREKDLEKLAQRIKGIKIAMMTTTSADGVLHSRPMATVDTGFGDTKFEGEIWFFTHKNTSKVDSIQTDTHVNLAYADSEDQTYVSVAGNACLIEDQEKMKELWSPTLQAYFPKGLNDPSIALICVTAESAEIWDAPSSPAVRIFGLAKSVVTGKANHDEQRSEHVTLAPH